MCPVCGKNEALAFRPGLSRCRACGLVCRDERRFKEPVYAENTVEDIYVSAKLGLFAQALRVLGKLAPAKGRLLDVGSAYGDFMDAAEKDGWKAEGVEISGKPAETASKKGFKVYTRPVEELGLPENIYNAVVVYEVFCLMAEPARATEEMFRILKPGGVLFAREFNASFHMTVHPLERKGLFGKLRPSIVHNFNFSAETLRVMLEREGFKDIKIRNSPPTSGDPYRTGGRLGGFLTGAIKVLYYWLAQALWVITLGRVFAGSTLIVTARK